MEFKKEAFDSKATEAAFKAHKNINTLFQTSDGQVFTKEQSADGHRARLENKEVAKVQRTATKAEDPKKGTSQEDGVHVPDAEKVIKAIDTVTELEAYVLGDTRQGVIKAAQERKEEIEAAQKGE